MDLYKFKFFAAVVFLILVAASAINGVLDSFDGQARRDSLDGLTVDVLGTYITASLTDSLGGMLTDLNSFFKFVNKVASCSLKMKCSDRAHFTPGSRPPT